MNKYVEQYEKGNITERELLFQLITHGPTDDLPDEVMKELKEKLKNHQPGGRVLCSNASRETLKKMADDYDKGAERWKEHLEKQS